MSAAAFFVIIHPEDAAVGRFRRYMIDMIE